MKLRRLREGDVLDDGEIVLVPGGILDRYVLRADAQRYHSVYGSYGLSVFAIRGATLEEMAQQVPLVRFAQLALIKVADVREAGLRLEPTGRNPRHSPHRIRYNHDRHHFWLLWERNGSGPEVGTLISAGDPRPA